jgi:Ca-activated chloride channel homolog
VSLARPWWLAGLALLLPLLLLHLRRPTLAVREVPSLLVWERIGGAPSEADRRLRPPRNPWLLALQALALVALVGALAGPSSGTAAPPRTTVYVLDDSLWMQIGSRSDDARRAILRSATADPHARVAVVTAGATPAVAFRGSATAAAGALAHLRPDASSGDLAAGITLGAGLLQGARGRLVVLRAPESPMPAVTAAPGQLSIRVVGRVSPDQGLFAPEARCGIGPSGACEVVATLRNGAARARIDGYTAFIDGRRAASLRVAVPARATSTIAFTAPAGSAVRLHLTSPDELAADDTAWVDVPGLAGAPAASTVTLVGDPSTALPLARAFASVPGVTLRLRTPATYRRRDALASTLVVLAGFLPRDGLPPSPAVALIAPPRLPGGSIDGAIASPTISGQAIGSELLRGVDLTSLTIDRGAAELLRLPPWLDHVLWTPSGPLLAAGDDGRRRLAVLAFDPARSSLTQLPALPILARNVVRWAAGWTVLGTGGSLTVDAVPGTTAATVATASGASTLELRGRAAGRTSIAPGVVTVTVRGREGEHRQTLDASLALPSSEAAAAAGGPIDLTSWISRGSPPDRRSLAPWLLVLALLAIAGDWACWRRLRR